MVRHSGYPSQTKLFYHFFIIIAMETQKYQKTTFLLNKREIRTVMGSIAIDQEHYLN
jgi:predicted class III extradiol MEMO1 family dioxygenase